ncbi:HNH endonuclease [Dyella jiangningensis]|uniref:HNH endonuclease signature motif containing protein n=1 Tax=Dyella sp. AtDHG13 TaxID=1938897 RepID=UPI0008883EEA|nr:HNH endonuclease signature motif containing protein [Dyella sp. AtDHG13]PXV54182.1 HNH endonuclease [Dyella sp. AtDHG13]SDL05056.1 HNH endonuclease [Dyella jiangningensis]
MIERMTDYVAQNYIPVPECGCWLWLGARDPDGYGKLGIHGRNMIRAHRLFYAFHKGPIPVGMQVCHKCDTPLCVNPDHLFLGSNTDNAVDRERKNRGRFKNHPPKNGRRGRHKRYIDEAQNA